MTNKDQSVIYLNSRVNANSRLLEETIAAHRSALVQFLKARLAHKEDRQDVMQELFLKLAAMDDLKTRLAGKTGSTRAYLYAILTNLIIDRERRAATRMSPAHESFDEESAPLEHPSPETVVASREQLERVFQLLKGMNAVQRNVVILNRFYHKTCQEIAEEMSLSKSSVERYMASALKVLRDETGVGHG